MGRTSVPLFYVFFELNSAKVPLMLFRSNNKSYHSFASRDKMLRFHYTICRREAAEWMIDMEITKETLISEIVENCPEAMPAFQAIGMHCMGCALASGENLEQACYAHGVDPDEFIAALTTYLETV